MNHLAIARLQNGSRTAILGFLISISGHKNPPRRKRRLNPSRNFLDARCLVKIQKICRLASGDRKSSCGPFRRRSRHTSKPRRSYRDRNRCETRLAPRSYAVAVHSESRSRTVITPRLGHPERILRVATVLAAYPPMGGSDWLAQETRSLVMASLYFRRLYPIIRSAVPSSEKIHFSYQFTHERSSFTDRGTYRVWRSRAAIPSGHSV